jgi:hypothetical protein
MMMESQRMKWMDQAAWIVKKRNVCKFVVGKPEVLGISRRRRENNCKIMTLTKLDPRVRTGFIRLEIRTSETEYEQSNSIHSTLEISRVVKKLLASQEGLFSMDNYISCARIFTSSFSFSWIFIPSLATRGHFHLDWGFILSWVSSF